MDENRTAGRKSGSKPPRRRRRRRTRLVWALLYVALVIGVSTLLASFGWKAANDVLALNKAERSATITLPDEIFTENEVEVEGTDEETGEVTITTKTVVTADIRYVADLLAENGMIEYNWVFRLFTKFTHSDTKLRPGTYTLNTDMDYRALIASMGSTSANRATVDVTFPEGSTVDQIFALMEEKGVATVDELQETAAEHDYAFSFLRDIPLGDYHRLEGYLFPDTYTFYLNEDPLTAINRLLVNFDARFTDEMRAKVAESEYSIRDILTIASMIEKETDGTDRARISSVIYNRLERPNSETAGYLNIDATIFYVTGRTVTQEDYQNVDSPYNTYLYTGLPPGPIANPGMASIRSAMNPAAENYYFYALGDDNTHHYFRTYAELQSFVASQERYQND